jgi:hypothetical protein
MYKALQQALLFYQCNFITEKLNVTNSQTDCKPPMATTTDRPPKPIMAFPIIHFPPHLLTAGLITLAYILPKQKHIHLAPLPHFYSFTNLQLFIPYNSNQKEILSGRNIFLSFANCNSSKPGSLCVTTFI